MLSQRGNIGKGIGKSRPKKVSRRQAPRRWGLGNPSEETHCRRNVFNIDPRKAICKWDYGEAYCSRNRSSGTVNHTGVGHVIGGRTGGFSSSIGPACVERRSSFAQGGFDDVKNLRFGHRNSGFPSDVGSGSFLPSAKEDRQFG